MDSLIKRWDATPDADLMLCEHRGVAYQADMAAGRVSYDVAYRGKIDQYDGAIAATVNAGRCALLARHLPQGASVLDIGSGSGSFMRAAAAAGFDTKGFEVMLLEVLALQDAGLFSQDADRFDAVTFWDSIEHMDMPELRLNQVSRDAFLFASVPVFEDMKRIRESKHYRPGEHLYYWTDAGFVNWMALRGFRLIERSAHETDAGRARIGAFAFRKDLPDYHGHIAAYNEMHSTRHYGSSATELHLDTIARVVQMYAPRSILDYGCGRSDLAAHFWLDGKRTLARYDPAIPAFKSVPEGRFDMIFCCDLMEHIPMASVDRVLSQIRSKGDRALFTISTKLARAKLPDGRNAHVTLLTKAEWTRWIADAFGGAVELPSKWEHELVLLAGATADVRRMAA